MKRVHVGPWATGDVTLPLAVRTAACSYLTAIAVPQVTLPFSALYAATRYESLPGHCQTANQLPLSYLTF